MNFAKIGVQGYSLGNLQLNSDELIWTSSDKSRQDSNFGLVCPSRAGVVLFPLLLSSRSTEKPNTRPSQCCDCVM